MELYSCQSTEASPPRGDGRSAAIAQPNGVGRLKLHLRTTATQHAQKTKSFELRAAMSMARLWRDQGNPQQARELLAPIYDTFTEGFDTLDLKEAKARLDDLATLH